MIKYVYTVLVLVTTLSCKNNRGNVKIESENIESITFDRKEPSLLIERDSNIVKYHFDTVVKVTKTGIDTTIKLNLKDSVILVKDSPR
tara:strand:+ start:5516 stop:5779 length:264 start_codon:yes stop_codon:yes gene_type:complete